MSKALHLGGKVRALRRAHKVSQARLAEQLGISASYLNLIEHNRRPLPAAVLLQLAKMFELDLATFADDDSDQVKSDLLEIFGDELFDDSGITKADVDELVTHHPNVTRAVRTLYEAWRAQTERNRALHEGDLPDLETVGRSVLPSEEVSDLLQQHQNYFPELEAAAEALIRDVGLDPHHVQEGLITALGQLGYRVVFKRSGDDDKAVRRILRDDGVIEVSELLRPRSRHFQLAHAVALLSCSEVLDRIVDAANFTHDESRHLARVALANYFAGAVLMPYEAFFDAAKEVRYDVELLGHRFRVSFEQVCHRLTTLRRPGREGVPFHLIRIDVAGNISKRFSASGIRFARYAGACPRWNVFRALLTPGNITTQLSTMPDGEHYFCLSRTLTKGDRGFHALHTVHAIGLGCRLEHAKELVYADAFDLSRVDQAVPIGVTCRLCERTDCEQRAMPAIGSAVEVNEDLRGVSFYAGVD